MRVLPRRLFVLPRARVETSRGRDGNACTTLRVEGLLCSVCADRVRAALEALPGVQEAQVDLDAGRASIEHDPALAGATALVRAVESAVVMRPLRRVLAVLGGPWRDPRRH